MELDRRAGPRSIEEERALVNEMRAGQESAFDEFMESYVPALYRYARRRLGGDRELTKDIVQSTVCRVIQGLDGWRAEAPLFTWLYACCSNEIAAHYRRRGRRPREVELVEDSDSSEVDPMSRIESAELVHLALDRIAPGYARVLEWRYIEGLGVGDVARRAGTTYKAAESLLSRARDAFRAACDQLSGSGRRIEGGAILGEEAGL
jgi:RNA polymerase sigma-70 factor, ECF subfamily